MIIKSMARKAPTFGQLIAYIGRDTRDEESFARNLYHGGTDARLVERQFIQNYRYLSERSGGNVLYHEIIALEGQPHLPNSKIGEMLHRIADLYCERRAPNNLVWGKVHYDTDFPHVHLMIGSNPVQSPLRTRLSKKNFAELQRTLEHDIQKQFPDLKLTPVYNQTKTHTSLKRARSEGERYRRTGQGNRKDTIYHSVKQHLSTARAMPELIESLKSEKLSLYCRSKNWGVEDQENGRKYRLSTLGLSAQFEEKFQKPLQNTDPRRAALERLAQNRLEAFEREEDRER